MRKASLERVSRQLDTLEQRIKERQSMHKANGKMDASRPLAIDLFTGLSGWGEGLIAEGWRVVGFDIEDMFATFGIAKPEHFQLVLQDVRTLHGSQFKDAALIVASPPCQTYSYRAMPWKRAKALPPPDNELFDACFRIQREACEAAGKNIPMVVENVRGAQKWVGRSRGNYGSFHLWGDVPALMPIGIHRKMAGMKVNGRGAMPHDFADMGVKCGGSPARKAVSAKIAKIPLPLAQHIARVYRP